MNHLDEGTIHAWIDGALDATRAREVDVHVAECAQCAAAVADARGLVAASSRILSALDDVPGGVIPAKRANPPKAPVRQWRAARWVTGIAAALMLAIGVTTWNRGAVQQEVASPPAGVASSPTSASAPGAAAAQPPAAPPASQKLAQPAVSAPTPVAGSVAGGGSNSGASRRATQASASSLGAAGPVNEPAAVLQRVGGAVVARAEPTRETRSDAAAEAAKAPVIAAAPPPPSAAAAAPPGGRAAARPALQDVIATSTSVRPSDAARADSTRLRSRMAFGATDVDVASGAGCYRLPGSMLLKKSSAVVGSIAEAAGKVARRTAAAPAAQAPAALVAPQPPAFLRLDTLRHPMGFVARSAASDSAVGWWKRSGEDSVTVDLLAAGVFRFAVRDRVTCPESP